MTAVNSTIGVNLKMEANPNPAVEPASPASRTDTLRLRLVLQGNVLRSSQVNQLSEGKKTKRNIHS